MRTGLRLVALALITFAAACGDDGGSTPPDAQDQPDAEATPDAGPACTATTFGTQEPLTLSASVAAWGGSATPVLGDGGDVLYQIEFYSGIETSLVGTFDLAQGNQANYMTCAVCFRMFSLDADGNIARQFYQSGGSVTLTVDPLTGVMTGSVTDLTLVEVTIDPDTFVSTPVDGGECLEHGALTLDANQVPSAWTCDDAVYDDGTNCNCECGASDPDCGIMNSPVVGCEAGEVCSNDMCVVPPANDTCTGATTVVVGVPVVGGTTVNSANNYNAGLEGAACTGFAMPGGDVAYELVLAADTNITVTLSNVSDGFDPAVALVGPGDETVCAANPITTCVAGADDGLSGDDETFAHTATTGTYYIIVDTFSSTGAGTFDLAVTLTPPSP